MHALGCPCHCVASVRLPPLVALVSFLASACLVLCFNGPRQTPLTRTRRASALSRWWLCFYLSCCLCLSVRCVAFNVCRVCGSSLFSPRLLEQRRHQAALSAFACRCLAALRAVLQQLRVSLRLPLAAVTPVVDVLNCMYTAASPLAEPAVQTVCALLRTLWGGVSLQLQLMPRGLEGLLRVVFQLQELQHTLLHAAVSDEPGRALRACLATDVPPEDDVMRCSGRYFGICPLSRSDRNATMNTPCLYQRQEVLLRPHAPTPTQNPKCGFH